MQTSGDQRRENAKLYPPFVAPLSLQPCRPACHYQDEMEGAGVTRATVNDGLIYTTYTGGPHLRPSANGLKFP